MEGFANRIVDEASRFAKAVIARGSPSDEVYQPSPQNRRMVIVPPRALPLAAILPGDGVLEQVVASGTLNTINLFNAAITIRLILTWFPQAPEAIVSPLSTICDPYLNLFRGIIPPIGGIDLSPILAFTALNLLSGTAAALPCEMPAGGRNPLSAGMKEPKKTQGWAAQLAQAQRDSKK